MFRSCLTLAAILAASVSWGQTPGASPGQEAMRPATVDRIGPGTPPSAAPWQWSTAAPQSALQTDLAATPVAYDQAPPANNDEVGDLRKRLADIEKKLKTPTPPAPPKPEEYPSFR